MTEQILLELEPYEELRFWAKVQKSAANQCWPWIAKSITWGYGSWRVRKVLFRANRVAWILHHKKRPPGGLKILHSCHNRACCNPAHLSPGTHLQNMQQMVAAGRHWRKGTAKPKVYKPHRTPKPIPELTGPDEDRFWSYVDRGGPGECWLWTAATDTYDYGLLKVQDRLVGAHRISYALANGYGHGLFVLHECDEPRCVNPIHLKGGTQRQNLEDMMKRGRGRKARGAAAGRALLEAADVIEIRERIAAGAKNADLAREFFVHPATIGSIKFRRSWKHL